MALTPDTDAAADQYRALLDVAESISLNRDLPALFEDLAHRLRGVVLFDYLNLVLHVPERNTMRLRVLTSTRPTDPSLLETPVDETPSGLVWQTQQAEREHILRVLRECNGVVGGPAGGAARLGLKRTTLQSRMQRLGITRGG